MFFKSKNNNHNVDRFFATLCSEDKDLDPVVQIYGRRAMQIRRSICKSKEAERRHKDNLLKYAERHRKGSRWPDWYHDVDQGGMKEPDTYPTPQPHPNTNEHAKDWDTEIEPVGPVGLLIESIVWNGLAIDKDFTVWQKGEEPISILKFPYQSLKKQLHMQAVRARTIAEWGRDTSTRMVGLREIDRQASLINPKLSEEEKGIVRKVQMGGAPWPSST